MEDLAYLVPESSSAWLGGHGDGRFRAYEHFYQSELASRKSNFDLEKVNEKFEQAGGHHRDQQQPRISRMLGKAAIGLFAIYAVSIALKATSHASPVASGAIVVGILVALRRLRKNHAKNAMTEK
jgi:hypothetical protein